MLFIPTPFTSQIFWRLAEKICIWLHSAILLVLNWHITIKLNKTHKENASINSVKFYFNFKVQRKCKMSFYLMLTVIAIKKITSRTTQSFNPIFNLLLYKTCTPHIFFTVISVINIISIKMSKHIGLFNLFSYSHTH